MINVWIIISIYWYKVVNICKQKRACIEISLQVHEHKYDIHEKHSYILPICNHTMFMRMYILILIFKIIMKGMMYFYLLSMMPKSLKIELQAKKRWNFRKLLLWEVIASFLHQMRCAKSGTLLLKYSMSIVKTLIYAFVCTRNWNICSIF